MIHEIDTLISFQLVWGYRPSITGAQALIFLEDLMDAHIQITAKHAIRKARPSRPLFLLSPTDLPPGTDVCVFYYTSRKNEPNRWLFNSGWSTATYVPLAQIYAWPSYTDRIWHFRVTPFSPLACEFMHDLLKETHADNTSPPHRP